MGTETGRKNKSRTGRRKLKTGERNRYSGMALLHGVELAGPEKVARAVRIKPMDVTVDAVSGEDPSIRVTVWSNRRTKGKIGFLHKIPLVRGLVLLIMAWIGALRALVSLPPEECGSTEQDGKTSDSAQNESMMESGTEKKRSLRRRVGIKRLLLRLFLAIAAVAVVAGLLWALDYGTDYLWLNTPLCFYIRNDCMDCLALLLLLLLASRIGPVHTLLKNHGAEHKTINCMERGLPLSLENIKKQKKYHPRCGTGIVALFLFFWLAELLFVPVEIHYLWGGALELVLVFVGFAVSYEIARFTSVSDSVIARLLRIPGWLLQKITVREPSDAQILCAMAAAERVLVKTPKQGSGSTCIGPEKGVTERETNH